MSILSELVDNYDKELRKIYAPSGVEEVHCWIKEKHEPHGATDPKNPVETWRCSGEEIE